MINKLQSCPVCGGNGKLYKTLRSEKQEGEFNYYLCQECECYFIDTDVINRMDAGQQLIKYNEDYWNMELSAAIERSYGAALARMAESIYYSRISINKFLDIGTGSGYFLDAIASYLPDHKDLFYGIEKFPPEGENHTKSKNYYTCDYKDLNMKFDGGMCIEVIEHLTPNMLKTLFDAIASVSQKGALYIVNSGLTEFITRETPTYLDPFVRGHIMGWSVKGIRKICQNTKFQVLPIRGKTWAFAMEFDGDATRNEDITDRIWSALPENLAILEDSKMGSVLKILGMETVRAYL